MRQKLLLLVLLLTYIFGVPVHAQVAPPCPTPPPPGAESCPAACVYCNFDGYMGINNGSPSGGNVVCGSISIHNDQWFGFVAGSSSISIDILTSNCQNGDGLQAAFFENCQEDAITCNPGSGGGGGQPLSLSYSGFVPGQTYYLMIDGWIGDVCNFEIDVVSGSVEPPPVSQPEVPQGPTKVCPGATVTYTIPEVPGAGYYRWTAPAGASINGGGNTLQIPAPDGTTVTITFGTAGGNVCVSVGNACTAPQQRCLFVTNQPIPPTIRPDTTICFEDLPFIWDEAPYTPISAAGVYNLSSSPYDSYLGCDSTVRQKVTVKGQIRTNIGFQYICDGECLTINGNNYCNGGGPFSETFNSFQGCDSVVTFTVVKIASNSVIQQPVPSLDCSNPLDTLSGLGSTVGANVVYSWQNSNWAPIGNQILQSINAGGTFHFIVTNTIGPKTCRDTASVTVNASLAPPGVTATGGVIGCLASNQNITLAAVSPTNGVNYQWSGPGITPANQNLQNPVVATPGSYSVTVTNPVNYCTSTATVLVIADNTPPTVSATGGTLTCAQDTLVIDGISSAPNSSFNWSGPGISTDNQNLEDPPVIVPGNYQVTVTNNINGCTSTASTSVAQDIDPPVAGAGDDKTITCIQAAVTLDGNGFDPSGGPSSYDWSGPGINAGNQNLETPTVDLPGEYIFTVTRLLNGCQRTDTVLVDTSLTAPIAAAGNDSTLTCAIVQITLNGAASDQGPNFTALWSGPGIQPSNQNQYNPAVSQPGAYTILVTNQTNGCTATDQVLLGQNIAVPSADAGQDQTISCGAPGVTLNGAGTPGTITYLWSGPGIGANNENLQNPLVTIDGVYTLQVTNTINGCTNTDNVEVSQDANVPDADAGPDLVLNCAVNTVNIDGSGSLSGPGVNYLWSGPGIHTGNNTVNNPTGILLPGTYSLTVTNTNNGCSNTDIVVVLLDTLAPQADAGINLVLNCYNNAADTLDASLSSQGANFQIVWTGPGIHAQNANLFQAPVSEPGSYTMVVTNTENFCSATDAVTVTLDIASPVAAAGTDKIIDCVTTSTVLGGSSSTGPNFTYTWSGPGINPGNTAQSNPTVSVSGAYTLTVTNTINGCTQTDEVDVILNATYPDAIAGPDQTITCFAPSLTLDGTASSSGPEFQYLWTGPSISQGNQNTPAPAINLPGTYILRVTNQNNSCVTADTVLIAEDTAPPTASAGADLRLDCQLTSLALDGSNSAAGADITYLWSGPAITPTNEANQSPVIDQPGIYTLLVSNTANGCTAQDVVAITQNILPPVASAGANITLTCAQPALPLNGNSSSSGPLFEYVWQGPGINTGNFSQQNPVVSDSGLYVLIVRNIDNKCTSSDTVYAGQNTELPFAEAGPSRTLTCALDTVALDGTQSLSGPGIVYTWTGPGIVSGTASSATPGVFLSGTYTLSVRNNANGCSQTDIVLVDQDVLPPLADAGPDQSLTCITVNGVTLSAAGSNTGPGFGLRWSGPGINASNELQVSPQVNLPGTYTVTITNNTNGCTATDAATVSLNQTLPTANAGPDRTITCSQPIVTLDGSGSSVGGTISVLWSGPGITPANQNTPTPSVSNAGAYAIVVTNYLTGCSSTDAVTVLLDTAKPDVSVSADTITCATPSVTLAASSAVPGVTYFWEGPGVSISNQTQAVFQIDQPGFYAVTVTAPNGCVETAGISVLLDGDFPDGTAEGAILNCLNGGQNTVTGDVDTPNATFFWSGPNNFFSNQISPTVSQPGTYVFTITGPNGCKRTLEAIVTGDFAAPIAVIAPPNQLDCNTPLIGLNANGSSIGARFTYNWTTQGGNIVSGANSLTPQVDRPGAYTLQVTDTQNGCTKTVTTQVINDPSVPTGLSLTVQDIPCAGQTNGRIAVRDVLGGTPPFLFSLNNAAPSANTQFNGLAAGIYTLRMEDLNGCKLDTVLQIIEPGPLSVELGDDQTVQLGEEVRVEAIIAAPTTPVKSIVWSPEAPCDTASTAPVCLEYQTLPKASYYQTITVTDENGCVASDKILILVRKDRYIYVPNAFNPNADNPINAILMIHGNISIARIVRWSIYGRWGESVFDIADFQADDPAYAWDGRYRGQDLSPGVYAWVAEVEFVDGEVVQFVGDVTIVK